METWGESNLFIQQHTNRSKKQLRDHLSTTSGSFSFDTHTDTALYGVSLSDEENYYSVKTQ